MSSEIAESIQQVVNSQNMPPERTVQRIPVEIWLLILQATTTSTLFPYLDDDSVPLSPSIIHCSDMFGVHDPKWFSYAYFSHPCSQYANHHTVVARLRRVCRMWNDIIERYIAERYRWMLTDTVNFHYPPSAAVTRQRPVRLFIDEGEYVVESLRRHIIPTSSYDALKSQHEQAMPTPSLILQDHDLSNVRMAVLGRVPSDAIYWLNRMKSIQALSIEATVRTSVWRRRHMSELLADGHLLGKLTYLHLFEIDPTSRNLCNNFHLNLFSLRYLALHFARNHFEKHPLFPRWTLGGLNALSLSGDVTAAIYPQNWNDFLARVPTLSEVLFDFRLDRGFWHFDLLICLWNRLPKLSHLGCIPESLGLIISVISKSGRSVDDRPPLQLFLLTNDCLDKPTTHEPIPPPRLASLTRAYQGGCFERIYLPRLQSGSEILPQSSKDVPTPRSSLINHCLRDGIPIYDTDGWQIWTN
ncbi:hypothetical protein CPB86DRAFT_813818 [Serendipita vermifera]|nr:hypothetical protein CPB86DRAFT_813818 [Serendipita vermifera]